MTALVEILQVKGIIHDLINISPQELSSANFELDDKHRAVNESDSIGATAHARDGELQMDGARLTCQCTPEKGELGDPRITLISSDVKSAVAGQGGKDNIIGCLKKFGDRG